MSATLPGGLNTRLDIVSYRYTLDEVFPFVTEQKTTQEYGGFTVKMNSDRYLLFRDKGCICVTCGRVGTFFMLRRNESPTAAPDSAHLNLWCEDEDGTLVMLTKDHIQPKSKGGANALRNYQPMCVLCNTEKGDGRTS